MKLQKMDGGVWGLDLIMSAHEATEDSECLVEPDIGGNSAKMVRLTFPSAWGLGFGDKKERAKGFAEVNFSRKYRQYDVKQRFSEVLSEVWALY